VKYLIDTDVLINYLRGKTKLDEKLIDAGSGISIITLGELIYGAYKSSDLQKSINLTKDFIKESGVRIIDTNQEIIYSFAQIKAGLEKNGIRLEDFDLLIGATAKAHSLILVTNNIRHFSRIPNLQIAKG